jgi:pimeloyl-ACP methyl ester carboxylesterase
MLRLSEPTIAGVRTVVMQSGPEASEEAIVFVHGNPGFSRDWEDLMERAGTICRCVAPDMPGFGGSILCCTTSVDLMGSHGRSIILRR